MRRKTGIILISLTTSIFISVIMVNVKPLCDIGSNFAETKEFNIRTSGFDFAEQIRIKVGTEPFSVFIGDANINYISTIFIFIHNYNLKS